MKSFVQRSIAGLIALSLLFTTARTQDIGANLSELAKFGSDAVKGWVSPLASGFGNGMNTAFYHSADLHDILGFDVGIKIGVARVTDEDKSYTLNTPPSLTMSTTYNGNPYVVTLTRGVHYAAQLFPKTAMGDETVTPFVTTAPSGPGGVIPAGHKFVDIPGGVSLPVSGALAPQLAIGLPFGIEVIGRILPTIEGDYGKLSMTGFGVRYDIDQWLPLFPVDIAVHFATQKLTLKDKADAEVFSASATAYGVEASKRFLFITLYTGFQLESSTITFGDITYSGYVGTTPTQLTIPGFEVEGSNSSRFTVGVRMLLLIINVHAEYSLAKNPMIGFGAGISIR